MVSVKGALYVTANVRNIYVTAKKKSVYPVVGNTLCKLLLEVIK